ncbi:hypothetical protein PFISCL1PPCAC_23031, partial [Pristionchus fissidentatus]
EEEEDPFGPINDILDNLPAYEIKDEEAESIPETEEEEEEENNADPVDYFDSNSIGDRPFIDSDKDEYVPLLNSSRKTRATASKIINYTESSGEEEKEEEKLDDEDYEEKRKEDDGPPTKKRNITNNGQHTVGGSKKEMQCPKCKKYRSSNVRALVTHLRDSHRITAVQ